MAKLVLIRHGQSMWNAQNRFTGWVDVPLSSKGIDEALAAGKQLQDEHFDCVFTSTLVRAQETAMLVLSLNQASNTPIIMHDCVETGDWYNLIAEDAHHAGILPVYCDKRLNERYYGDLQGKDKDQMREEYGAEQVHIWRRSYSTCPPNGESLELTCKRTLPCFEERIMPLLNEDKNILISAHGNSLRSIIMRLDSISEDDITRLEIATGQPISYEFKENSFIKLV